MRSNRYHFRYLAVVLLLLSAGMLLQARSKREIIAPRLALSSFPTTLGTWTGTDLTIDQETLKILGPGDFLLRDYQNTSVREAPIGLFIAYFPSQRAGDTIHSPKNCLPGAGWNPIESSQVMLSLPGHSPFPANRYLIARGDDRELVFYWYQAHDRALASEYWAKFYLISDAIRMNRSDGSLVRFATPLQNRERPSTAEDRIASLGAQVVDILNNYVPR